MPFATGLFGTHVSGSASKLGSFAEVFLLQSQPEICNIRFIAGVDEDVGGLDVSVNESLAMGVVECFSDRCHQFCRLSVRRTSLLNLRGKVAALDQFRDDVAQTVRGAEIVNRHDVSVIETGEYTGFGQICLGFFLGKSLSTWNLDRHGPFQLVVMSEVDPTEPAFAQDLLDAVATDLLGVIRWERSGQNRRIVSRWR